MCRVQILNAPPPAKKSSKESAVTWTNKNEQNRELFRRRLDEAYTAGDRYYSFSAERGQLNEREEMKGQRFVQEEREKVARENDMHRRNEQDMPGFDFLR